MDEKSCFLSVLQNRPLILLQEKLYSEIEEEIKRSGKDVLGFDELLEMRYLNSCIQGSYHILFHRFLLVHMVFF